MVSHQIVFDELLITQEDLLATQNRCFCPVPKSLFARSHSCLHLTGSGFWYTANHFICGLKEKANCIKTQLFPAVLPANHSTVLSHHTPNILLQGAVLLRGEDNSLVHTKGLGYKWNSSENLHSTHLKSGTQKAANAVLISKLELKWLVCLAASREYKAKVSVDCGLFSSALSWLICCPSCALNEARFLWKKQYVTVQLALMLVYLDH